MIIDTNTPSIVAFGDNLEILKQIPDASFKIIYIDPPFNTGIEQPVKMVTGQVLKEKVTKH